MGHIGLSPTKSICVLNILQFLTVCEIAKVRIPREIRMVVAKLEQCDPHQKKVKNLIEISKK